MRTTISIVLLLAAPASAETVPARLAAVDFDRGSAELASPRADEIRIALDRVAAWALDNPDGVIVVNGHADRGGPRIANIQLSLARAHTVRAELVEAGVNPDQIIVVPMGKNPAERGVVVWGTGRPQVTREWRKP